MVLVQADLDMTDWPRNWQAAVQRVLENVLKLPEALPFAEPVPLDEVPGYRELVPNPMDLGTVLGRSKADHYDTPLEALADVRQVSTTLCFSFAGLSRQHILFIRSSGVEARVLGQNVQCLVTIHCCWPASKCSSCSWHVRLSVPYAHAAAADEGGSKPWCFSNMSKMRPH